MMENPEFQKLSGNPARSPSHPTIEHPSSPDDLCEKSQPAARAALLFLRSVSEYKPVSDIAKKITMGHTNWAVRSVRTLLFELLQLPQEQISNETKQTAFHFAIALQKNRKSLALLHMKRSTLYSQMGLISFAIANALRAISLDRDNSNAFLLLCSFLLEGYKYSSSMPPEIFRMAHKMAHIGWKIKPTNLGHLNLTFDVSIPPSDLMPRTIDDDCRKEVTGFALSIGDSSQVLLDTSNIQSRSIWWSNTLHILIMDTLPRCTFPPRLRHFNQPNMEIDQVKVFFGRLAQPYNKSIYFEVNHEQDYNRNGQDNFSQSNITQVGYGDFVITLHCTRKFSPGEVIFEEDASMFASTIGSTNQSLIPSSISSHLSTSSQTFSVRESARRRRYVQLRRWAQSNDYPEVLLVWQYLVHLKQVRYFQESESTQTREYNLDDAEVNERRDRLLVEHYTLNYMAHPTQGRYKNHIQYRIRFWYHYSAYIRLSWAWGFCKEHQEFDFEWYLDLIGTFLFNAHRLSPPNGLYPTTYFHDGSSHITSDNSGNYKQTKPLNGSQHCYQQSPPCPLPAACAAIPAPSNDPIPGDMVIKVTVQGSPFIPVIPGDRSKITSEMALFQIASFIPNDCINPTIEYNIVWTVNGPRLQVVALNLLLPGTSLSRSILSSDVKVDRRVLAKFGSICSCSECECITQPIQVDI